VERVELEREGGFDLGAAHADLGDGHGLEHHDLAAQLAEDGHARALAPLVDHGAGTIAQTKRPAGAGGRRPGAEADPVVDGVRV